MMGPDDGACSREVLAARRSSRACARRCWRARRSAHSTGHTRAPPSFHHSPRWFVRVRQRPRDGRRLRAGPPLPASRLGKTDDLLPHSRACRHDRRSAGEASVCHARHTSSLSRSLPVSCPKFRQPRSTARAMLRDALCPRFSFEPADDPATRRVSNRFPLGGFRA